MRLPIVIFAMVGSLLIVGVAFGHAAPERFSPAPGAVLAAAPKRVDAWFVQDVRRNDNSFLRVLDSEGNSVEEGVSVIDDQDRRHMYVNVKTGLGDGRYLVVYQTQSDEDEDIAGACFLLFVGQAAADKAHDEKVRIDDPDSCPVKAEEESGSPTETPATTSAPTATLEQAGDGDDVSVGAVIGVAIAAAAGGLILGGVVGSVMGRRRQT